MDPSSAATTATEEVRHEQAERKQDQRREHNSIDPHGDGEGPPLGAEELAIDRGAVRSRPPPAQGPKNERRNHGDEPTKTWPAPRRPVHGP